MEMQTLFQSIKVIFMIVVVIILINIAESLKVIASLPDDEQQEDSLIQTQGKYTIDLPEEISESNGHDLAVSKQGNTIYIYFPRASLHEYQADIDQDGTTVYCNERIVGRLKFNPHSSWDKLMMKDNE